MGVTFDSLTSQLTALDAVQNHCTRACAESPASTSASESSCTHKKELPPMIINDLAAPKRAMFLFMAYTPHDKTISNMYKHVMKSCVKAQHIESSISSQGRSTSAASLLVSLRNCRRRRTGIHMHPYLPRYSLGHPATVPCPWLAQESHLSAQVTGDPPCRDLPRLRRKALRPRRTSGP